MVDEKIHQAKLKLIFLLLYENFMYADIKIILLYFRTVEMEENVKHFYYRVELQ